LALASGGSILTPAGIDSIRHGGSFLQLLTEATPIAPPRYQNLATQTCNTALLHTVVELDKNGEKTQPVYFVIKLLGNSGIQSKCFRSFAKEAASWCE